MDARFRRLKKMNAEIATKRRTAPPAAMPTIAPGDRPCVDVDEGSVAEPDVEVKSPSDVDVEVAWVRAEVLFVWPGGRSVTGAVADRLVSSECSPSLSLDGGWQLT
jgi:hypothetical protein